MKTRDGVVEYQKTLDDAGTLTKDMDFVDPVSALYLEFEATNGTTSNEDNFISDVITKVEVVDGSEVLYSLNMSQLEALYFLKTGKIPTLFPSEWPGGNQRHGVLLMFGRYLWDQDYGMDFKRFSNPQLKITSNLSAIRTAAAAGAFVPGSLKGTIVAKVMEDPAVRPSQYLMAKQIENFTSGSGEKRIDLPRDLVYRMLLARFWVEGSDLREVITDLKLTCDADKYIAFNRKTQQLDAEALAIFGRGELKHDVTRANGGIARLLFNMEPNYQPRLWSNSIGRMVNVINTWSSQVTIGLFTDAITADGTARDITGVESGHALHATLPIPFGLMNDPATWFNPKDYAKVELVCTQAVAAACEIAAEMVRSL